MATTVTLVFEEGPEAGKSVTLTATRTIIGRRKGDVRIKDEELSSTHAEINIEGEKVEIRDLNSTNGTFVNDEKLPLAQLKDGDLLKVGSSRIRVKLKIEAPPPPPRPPEPPPPPKPKGLGALIADELEGFDDEADVVVQAQEALKLPWRTRLSFEVLEGPDKGLRVPFTKGTMLIGRRNADVLLKDSDVSGRHAVVEAYARNKVFIKDLKSTNGTFVNGSSTATEPLKNGDTVRVGQTILRFQVEELK